MPGPLIKYRKEGDDDFSFSRLTLAFTDKTFEKMFKESYFKSNLQLGRTCHFIAIFFYTLVGIWNVSVINTANASVWWFVIVTADLFFLIGFFSSFLFLNLYSKYWQPLFAFYVLMTGAGFTIVTITSDPTYPVDNFAGIIFCLFFCYTFIRLTFLWATIAGNTIVMLYAAGVAAFSGLSFKLFSTTLFYMFGINLLGMMVCYAMELISRRDFILNYLLKKEENKTRDINLHLEQIVKERTRELELSVQQEKKLVLKLEKEEKILQQSLKSLEQAEDIAKLGYFERNWKLDENYCSRGFLKILGIENNTNALSHDDFIQFVHKDDREMIIETIQSSVFENKNVNIELRLIQKNGREIQVQIVADHFYGDDNEPLITRGVFQDITDRKAAEETLAKLEGQLIQAQKMESVGRLAGGVAHDYNNISSIVLGYTELSMDMVEKDNPLYPNLEAINNAARRASDITRQLLAFARKQTIAPKVVDLNKTVKSMVKMLRRLIGEDIELSFLITERALNVKIDPSQVDQILANLCVNARDAIRNVGKIVIETKTAVLDEAYCNTHAGFIPGEYALLSLSDTGKGMNSEIMENIFEPFFTTKEAGQGTGLGLATVYGIVKQNNGLVNVYSEPGIGTTIKIYLPKCDDGKAKDIIMDSPAVSGSKGENILLVEDSEPLLDIEKKVLKNLGYNVTASNSPEEAVDLVKNKDNRFQVLITDVIMPKMNGHEMASQMQKIDPELKVIFMSGYTADVISHHGVLGEGVNFISKPFSKKELSRKIREVLQA